MISSTMRRALIGMVGNSFAPLSALATAPVLAQALGVDGRGTVAAATAPLMLATSLAAFGLPVAVTYFVARQPGLLDIVLRRTVGVAAAVGLAVSGGLIALAGLLAGGDDELRMLVMLTAAALVPTLLGGLLQAAAAGLHLWRHVAAERLVTNAGRLVAISTLAMTHHLSITACVAVMALSPLVGTSVYLRKIVLRPRQHFEVQQVRSGHLVSFGMRVWVGSLSGVVLARIDQVLMSPLVGSHELGLYVVAVSLSEVPLVVNSAIREVLFTTESAQADPVALARAARLSTMVTTLVAGAVAGLAGFAIPLLFGAAFSASTPVCLVLLCGVTLGNPGSLAGVGLSARGRPGLRSTALSIACVVNIVATIVLVVPLGALGAAIATMIGNVVSGGLNLLFLRAVSGIPVRAFLGIRRSDLRDLVVASSLRREQTYSSQP